jgi:hypothetical protein
MVTYGLGGHSFGLGYRKMSGDAWLCLYQRYRSVLANYVQIGDFATSTSSLGKHVTNFNFASIGILA